MRSALVGVAGVLALLVLAPVLGGGFVLVYDMVFAPRQSLLPGSLGLGSALPRSVPADAVIAAATAVLPGDVVQQVVLVAALFAGPLGAGLLVPTGSLGVRIVAAVSYGWSGYVAERLFIGHWPYLVAYACLPWIARAARVLRDPDRPGAEPGAPPPAADREPATAGRWRVAGWVGAGRPVARLVVALAPAALTPSGGLLGAVVAVVCGGWRRLGVTVPLAVVVNAPWWVPAVLHPAGGLSASAGAAAFGARAEGWGGPLLSLLGLGGLWNAEAVPASRANPLVPLLTLAVTAVAVVGWWELRRRWGPGSHAVVGLGVVGVLLGLLGGTAVVGWLAANVPGGGLLRDSQKWVAWWALPLAIGFALGVGVAASRLTRRAGRALLVAATVLPVAMMPDLAWGGWGRLSTVDYPADWARVHALLDRDQRPGDVLALPLSAFRQFAWNDRRTQLDPAPRALPRTVLTDDTLWVAGTPVPGEDRRVAAARAAVSAGTGLGRLGIGWVLVERGTPGPAADRLLDRLTPVYRGDWLELYRVTEPVHPTGGAGPPVAAVLTADAVALVTVTISLLWLALPTGSLMRSRRRRRE